MLQTHETVHVDLIPVDIIEKCFYAILFSPLFNDFNNKTYCQVQRSITYNTHTNLRLIMTVQTTYYKQGICLALKVNLE